MVKWCITVLTLTRWVTVCLTDKVVGDVEMTINTSIVKWCQVTGVSSHYASVGGATRHTVVVLCVCVCVCVSVIP